MSKNYIKASGWGFWKGQSDNITIHKRFFSVQGRGHFCLFAKSHVQVKWKTKTGEKKNRKGSDDCDDEEKMDTVTIYKICFRQTSSVLINVRNKVYFEKLSEVAIIGSKDLSQSDRNSHTLMMGQSCTAVMLASSRINRRLEKLWRHHGLKVWPISQTYKKGNYFNFEFLRRDAVLGFYSCYKSRWPRPYPGYFSFFLYIERRRRQDIHLSYTVWLTFCSRCSF